MDACRPDLMWRFMLVSRKRVTYPDLLLFLPPRTSASLRQNYLSAQGGSFKIVRTSLGCFQDYDCLLEIAIACQQVPTEVL